MDPLRYLLQRVYDDNTSRCKVSHPQPVTILYLYLTTDFKWWLWKACLVQSHLSLLTFVIMYMKTMSMFFFPISGKRNHQFLYRTDENWIFNVYMSTVARFGSHAMGILVAAIASKLREKKYKISKVLNSNNKHTQSILEDIVACTLDLI